MGEVANGNVRSPRSSSLISEMDGPERDELDDPDSGKPDVREELVPIPLKPRFGHTRYAARKTIAQGLMDVALLLANASQLKSVLERGPSHTYFELLLTMIILSILLQVSTGFLLLWVGSRESKSNDTDDVNDRTNRLNNATVAIIFLITVLNILITSFGIGDQKRRHEPLINPATAVSGVL